MASLRGRGRIQRYSQVRSGEEVRATVTRIGTSEFASARNPSRNSIQRIKAGLKRAVAQDVKFGRPKIDTLPSNGRCEQGS
jgi:hypothetical protein